MFSHSLLVSWERTLSHRSSRNVQTKTGGSTRISTNHRKVSCWLELDIILFPSLEREENMDMTLNTSEMGYKIVYPPDLWVYTDDPTDLRSYMRQTERGFARHFQNSTKHFRCAPVRIKVQPTVRILETLLTLLKEFFHTSCDDKVLVELGSLIGLCS